MLAVRVHEPDDERPCWYLALLDAIHNVSPIDGSLGFIVERNHAISIAFTISLMLPLREITWYFLQLVR
jgi:hypothetical protein